MLPFDFGSIFWMAICLITVIVAIVLALVHEYVILPKISRDFRHAKWFSTGVTAMIQDLAGNVRLYTSGKELPEGAVKTKKGWFLLPIPGTPIEELVGTKAQSQRAVCPECGSTGKHHKDCSKPPRLVPNPPAGEKELADYAELYGLMVHVPTLAGFGKQIFFGSVSSPMLSNLWTLAHADLLKAKGLVPMNMQKTQLDAVETGARREGMLMMGSDVVRWIFYVIMACIPIAVIALCFWFLTQGNA
jgi:hypothetical protein